MVSWREQPTRKDIEALRDNIARVGLVVRIRWVLLAGLAAYSLVGASFYAVRLSVHELVHFMGLPGVALLCVAGYNTFYQLNYRKLGNIAVWNDLQLVLDVLVVTVLVYFSGGIDSWFWSMYSLFIIEAALILPRSRDAWLLALGSIILLGSIELLELVRILPHQAVPFTAGDRHLDPIYFGVRYLWQVAVIGGTASIATLVIGQFRGELHARSEQTAVDVSTGLFTRGYFDRALVCEVRRAIRERRQVHVILVDIDQFGVFNRDFGIDAGDRLVEGVAVALQSIAAAERDSANVVARIGGEEFAILVIEDEARSGTPSEPAALNIAKRAAAAAEAVRISDAGVTVSVGVSTLSAETASAEDLLDRADAALAQAIALGGHQVVCAREVGGEIEARDVRAREFYE